MGGNACKLNIVSNLGRWSPEEGSGRIVEAI